MELKQLRYFLAVAEHQNFSRAADSLYVSQPALSHQISELERELGEELFVRGGRSVYLTAAGRAMLGEAQEAVSRSERIREIVSGNGGEIAGAEKLRIVFDDTEDHFDSTGITEKIAAFGKERPGLKISVQSAPFPDCQDMLRYGETDAAFLLLRHNEALPPEFKSRIVHRDRLILVVEDREDVNTCRDAVERYEVAVVSNKPRGRSRMLKSFSNMGLEPRLRTVDSVPVSFITTQMGETMVSLPKSYFEYHRFSGLKTIDIPDPAADIFHAAVWVDGAGGKVLEEFLNIF